MSKCELGGFERLHGVDAHRYPQHEKEALMSPDLRSKYMADAAAKLAERADLSETNRELVEEQESLIKLAHTSLNDAMKAINEAVKNNKLSEANAEIERGNAKADCITIVNEAESKILKVHPRWSNTVSKNVQDAIDSVSRNSIKGAQSTGEYIGKALNTPVQVLKGLFDGVRSEAGKAIK